jgi:hypothetical protein
LSRELREQPSDSSAGGGRCPRASASWSSIAGDIVIREDLDAQQIADAVREKLLRKAKRDGSRSGQRTTLGAAE